MKSSSSCCVQWDWLALRRALNDYSVRDYARDMGRAKADDTAAFQKALRSGWAGGAGWSMSLRGQTTFSAAHITCRMRWR